MSFIDEVKIHVKSGDGGAGCVSFRREKFIALGGPDGGDGGKGGDVICKVSPQLSTLLDLRQHPHQKAGRGRNGMGKDRHGAGRRRPGDPAAAGDGDQGCRDRRDPGRPDRARFLDRAAERGPGRAGKRPFQDGHPQGAQVRPAGRAGRGALDQAGAEADGGRRAPGDAERRANPR